MKATPFVIERVYDAPIDKVWKAITDKDQMKQWYFDLVDFKAEAGFEFRFVGETEDKSYLHLCRVTEVQDGKRLTHSWRYDGFEGESFVTWELFPEGDQTKVILTHRGLETFPQNNPDFNKQNFSIGWNEIVAKSLKQFVEDNTSLFPGK